MNVWKSVYGWCVGFDVDSGECLGDVIEKNMLDQVCYAACCLHASCLHLF